MEKGKLLPHTKDRFNVRAWKPYDADSIYYKVTDEGYSVHIGTHTANMILLEHTLTLRPDTTYVVSAFCKTRDVVDHESPTEPFGACIGVGDDNTSKSVLGSRDGELLRVLGRTDHEGRLTVSFWLGYFCHTCTGEAWFEGMTYIPVEEFEAEDRTWRFLNIVLANTAFQKEDGTVMQHRMNDDEIASARHVMARVARDMTADSNGLLLAKADVMVSYGLFDSYKYSEEFGYCMTHEDAYQYCRKHKIDLTQYDHVAFVMCQPELQHTYFGLGGCFVKGFIGHTSVLYHDPEPLIRSADPNALWPQGVYVHEFLHAAENYSDRLGYAHTTLHNGREYGYTDADGWRRYYSDVMQNKIFHQGRYIGIDPVVWRIPPHIFN